MERTWIKDPNPWIPISDVTSLQVLGKFIEELNECGAASARCIIQGIDEVEPSTNESNRFWLTNEIADVLANLELVVEHFDLDLDYIGKRVNFKQEYLRRWHNMQGVA